MGPKEFILYIWNGGLDPAIADLGQLRQRRTVSSMTILFMPVAIILILANLFIFDGKVENIHITLVFILGLFSLYMQAFYGWERFAALAMVASFWIAPTSLMYYEGFSSSNWVWMLPTVLASNLVASRRTAIVFTVICVITLIYFAVLTLSGRVGQIIQADAHAITVAISGSLIFIMACILGYTFRTTQLNTEAKLKAHVKQLGEEVETRREAELAALAGERSKAIFLATISHELRTPLNGVIGAGQLLASKADNAEQQELIDVVTNSGEILLDLINNVLDFSRLEAGGFELETKPMQLESVIKSGIAPLFVSGKEKQVAISCKIAPDVPQYVLGDASRIRQIILNLCGNALKFTHSGHVDVLVSKTEQDENDPGYIKIDVADTGIGIADDVIDRLFKPFTQAETSTARRFGGSGLGLTIVSQLVELFEGSVSVQSELGVGSVFTVKLPLPACSDSGQQADVAASPATISRPNETITVLITDDNAVNRKVANKMLQQLGCAVVEATDGYEALASISEGNIDVVLMDIQMPNMDGLTATAKIRQMNSPLCNTPIIGLSANAMPSDKSEMIAAGMNDYLSKPVRMDQLQNALSETNQLSA